MEYMYMKKLLIAGLIVLATPVAAFANSAGCGAGSMIFKGQSGLGPNILAATTNGSFGNQTFGMSSGTLGCNQNDTISAAADTFIDHNMERVARDMSTGGGEALDTLASLMGIQAEDKAAFFAATQASFSSIYSHGAVTSSDVVASLVDVMKADAALAKYVA
jgi:hypothetical protein